MKQTKLIMGMPISVEVIDSQVTLIDFKDIFRLFKKVDEQFSPYKKTSEVSRINRKEINPLEYSSEMKEIIDLSEKAKIKTDGYFDVYHKNYFDPSGIVKGWVIQKAVELLRGRGFKDFYIDAGGDIYASGLKDKKKWRVGIRNPFKYSEVIKVVSLSNQAIATSGTAIRGDHIYNPHQKDKSRSQIASVSVLGKSILEVDLLATATFAMGEKGIDFINAYKSVESYMIDGKGIATYTSGLEKYLES